MPRRVSASEAVTARVSIFALITCGVSAAFAAVANPPVKSATANIECPIRIIRLVFISTSLPCRSFELSPATGFEPLLTIRHLLSNLLLQNFHQVVVAFLRIHQRELGDRHFLQLRIFFSSRNGYQRVRVALNEERVEDGFLVFAVGFLGVEREQSLFCLFRTDQSEISNRRAPNLGVLFTLCRFREEFRITGEEERLQNVLFYFGRSLSRIELA